MEVAQGALDALDLGERQDLDIRMPADLDQFG
jgi:hypothetical protein